MSNPFELALQAKQKKIEVKSLTAAAKAVYDAFNEDEIKRYIPKPAEPYNPYKDASNVGSRTSAVSAPQTRYRNFRG